MLSGLASRVETPRGQNFSLGLALVLSTEVLVLGKKSCLDLGLEEKVLSFFKTFLL
jgi:hypothetical protein